MTRTQCALMTTIKLPSRSKTRVVRRNDGDGDTIIRSDCRQCAKVGIMESWELRIWRLVMMCAFADTSAEWSKYNRGPCPFIMLSLNGISQRFHVHTTPRTY